jgi:hypothetical protein
MHAHAHAAAAAAAGGHRSRARRPALAGARKTQYTPSQYVREDSGSIRPGGGPRPRGLHWAYFDFLDKEVPKSYHGGRDF